MRRFQARKSYGLPPAALLALLLHCAWAHASDEPDTSMYSLKGFGTLGVVHSNESKADFSSSVFKPDGAGRNQAWSANVDSLLAAQLTVKITSQWLAVLQVIADQNYDNSYRPEVEWANIKYQFTPDFSVRAGRIVLASFLAAEYRQVGYANPWVRPPLEVYALLPVTSNDGVDASYRLRWGDMTTTLQATYGSRDLTTPGGRQVHGRNQWGLFGTAESGALTLHASYFQTQVTVDELQPLFDAFRQFGPEGVSIAEKYDCSASRVSVTSLGVSFDQGNWFLMGELAKRSSACFIGANTGWYASGGYRLGKFTPFLSYAQVQPDSPTSAPGLTVSALPAFLAGTAMGLNAGLNSALAASASQRSISVGGRWDFLKNTAFKLQLDHILLGDGSQGVLTNVQPGFQPGGTVNIFSATMDFVF